MRKLNGKQKCHKGHMTFFLFFIHYHILFPFFVYSHALAWTEKKKMAVLSVMETFQKFSSFSLYFFICYSVILTFWQMHYDMLNLWAFFFLVRISFTLSYFNPHHNPTQLPPFKAVSPLTIPVTDFNSVMAQYAPCTLYKIRTSINLTWLFWLFLTCTLPKCLVLNCLSHEQSVVQAISFALK